MGKPDNMEYRVKATETTFAILETVNASNGIRLTKIADELDMPKSTVHRYLQTLLANGYIIREGDEYYIGLRFLDYGWNARNRKEGYKMAESIVKELAEETDDRAQFIVEEHGYAIYIHRETGSHAVLTDPGIGKRVCLHATSHGKAIMSRWPEERVHEHVDRHGLPEYTQNTITERSDLLAELEKVRERGYSLAREEHTENIYGMGTPVMGRDDNVLGALSVSGLINRMEGDWFKNELPDNLIGYANEIELNLKHS